MAEEEQPTGDELLEVVNSQQDALARLIGIRGPDEPYFEKIEVDVPTGKLIALDAAVMSAHLFVGIVLFKSIPKLFEDAIAKVQKSVTETAAKSATFALLKFIGAVLRMVMIIADSFNQEERSRELEQRIRKASAFIRKEIIAAALKQAATGRKRRRVYSRHRTKPQRKANLSWQTKPPRSRKSRK